MRAARLLSLALGFTACAANDPSYFPPAAPLEVGQPGDMTGTTSTTMALVFRQPTADERQKLDEESAQKMFAVPWLRASDIGLSVLYTITNLDDHAGSAQIDIDGASEFASYDGQALRAAAAAMPSENQPAVLSLIEPKPVLVAAGGSTSGIVGEDDFLEAALDLDAIGRFGAVPAEVLVNRSEVNPIGLEMIPAGHVRPALDQIEVTFSATVHMKLEFLVRVRDKKHLLLQGDGDAFAPTPTAYTPPPPPPPAP